MSFEQIKPAQIELCPFATFDKGWALVTAGTEDHLNTMTVSWGSMGTLWQKPAATVYIRQSRYTKEFVDAQGYFSVSFLPEEYRKQLGYLGSASGRDEDKVAKAGLTPIMLDETPAFEEASLVLVCQKAYAGLLAPENFIDPKVDASLYPDQDYHTMYVGYVDKAFRKA
ncbi:MAG: flavin reductase [Atopobiaceae bacterium]|jgi:flavin reductase (DIM6/NTAB) family NADH-FMN oxidoreductase RutF|nr:flavin reductase [Atopobiaceae bacterium]